jgi:chorismate mutase
MRKLIFILFSLLIVVSTQAAIVNGNLYGNYYGRAPVNPFTSGTAIEGYLYLAERTCKDMSCVQQSIRLIDSQIASLLARRLAFAQRAAQLKNSTIVSDNQQQNPNVITQVIRQAQAQGVPPQIAQSVFEEISKQSLAYENKYEGMTPQPSPNSLGVPTRNVNNPVITPTIIPGLGVTPTVTAGARIP